MRCFCTVATWSHLRMARILAASLQQAGNLEILHVLIPDAEKNEVPPDEEGITYHGLDEVRGDFPELMPYYYDEFELCNGLRPFFLSLLFRQGHRQVVYLDSDIYVTASFEPIWKEVQPYSLLITPHQLNPPALNLSYTNEIAVVDQGVYNSGFSAWNLGTETEQILRWMCERFPLYVFVNRKRFMFGDQKLYPLIENYFPDRVKIFRQPWLNIAFWNSHERNVEVKGGSFRCGGEPALFFHLSGYRRSHPDLICNYFSRQMNEEILRAAPWFREVLFRYTEIFDAIPATPGRSYRFNRLRGMRLNPDLRWRLFEKGSLRWGDPFVLRSLFWHGLKRIKRRSKRLLQPKMIDGARNEDK